MTRLEEALEASGIEFDLDWRKKSAWDLQRRWRAAFLPEWTEWTGGYALDWNALPNAGPRLLSGASAIDALGEHEQRLEPASLCEELGRPPVIRLGLSPGTGRRLQALWAGDVYVIHRELKWCFVLTHEGLGPYFLRADGDED